MTSAPVSMLHRSVTPLDAHLGAKLRETRIEKGLSQTALGKAIGVSFQQIQKYEKAINRISASTLYECCQVLDVEIISMFDGFDPKRKKPPASRRTPAAR